MVSGVFGSSLRVAQETQRSRFYWHSAPRSKFAPFCRASARGALAPHPANAHAWIDATRDPDGVASISNETFHLGANTAAVPELSRELVVDPMGKPRRAPAIQPPRTPDRGP
jgi:hypothetical protein